MKVFLLSIFTASLFGATAFSAVANDCILYTGFESCPLVDEQRIRNLEERVDDLEILLSDMQADLGGRVAELERLLSSSQLPIGSLIGRWVGNKVYDRGYSGTSSCFDDEVIIDIINDGEFPNVQTITTIRAGAGLAIFSTGSTRDWRVRAGSMSNRYQALEKNIDLNLRFFGLGQADGFWTEGSVGCFGTYQLTKQ
jgi:hypothetical protein